MAEAGGTATPQVTQDAGFSHIDEDDGAPP
jgi:hypothetical protein